MAQIKGDTQRLMGPEKAAIFMLALGSEQSAKLFEMMDDEEIRELSQIMAGLGSINAHTIEQLFVDFADQISGAAIKLSQTAQMTIFAFDKSALRAN